MSKPCEDLASALADGRPLRPDQRQHLAHCEPCALLAGLPARVRAATTLRSAVEPGPGFAARVARRAIEASSRRRRRQRVLGGLAAAGAAAAVLVGLALRPDRPKPGPTPAESATAAAAAPAEPAPAAGQAVEELRYLADVDDALAFSADWSAIEEPLDRLGWLTPPPAATKPPSHPQQGDPR